jgi:hypothetical protein
MPQIILWFPYGGMDFRHDPDMVLPPGEDWDQRGMLVYFMFCDFDSIAYVYIWMDVDSIIVCVCVDVGPRGREAELVAEPDSSGASETIVGRAMGGREMSEG